MAASDGGTIVRRRASRVLRERALRRAAIVIAPVGFGTSSLARRYAADADAIYVEVVRGASLARFVGDLISAVAERLGGELERSFAGAYARASQSADPPRTLAAWFTRQLHGVPCRIAIDGLDRSAGTAAGAFVRHAIAFGAKTTSWMLTMHDAERFPLDSLLAFGHASLPIGERELRLHRDEFAALATSLGCDLSRAETDAIARKAAGSIANASFYLAAHAAGVAAAADPAWSVARLVARDYATFCDAERAAAICVELLPTRAAVERVARIAHGPLAALSAVRERAPYLFEGDGVRFQQCVRIALATLAQRTTPERQRAIVATAAALESIGDLGGALTLLAQTRDEALVIAGIERHAAAALEGEHLHFMHDAIETLADATRRSHPLVLAFLAMEASLGNQIDLAESYFLNALNALEHVRDAAQAQRVRYWYATELVRRFRPADAVELLKPGADFFQMPVRLRVATMSTLAAACAMDGSQKDARRWIGRALQGVAEADDLALTARVHHQASYVALCGEDAPEARRLADIAARLAERAGTAHVMTGAYSVLYAVAMDLEDDLADAAVQLHRISTGAARAGSVVMQLYALAASYELETDRGNATAIASLERELAEFDLHYGASTESETILPAQAMQHAWRGDFVRAYRTLAGSEHQQAADDRKALRAAEIALYAAAAGLPYDAAIAVEYALARLPNDTLDVRAARARTTAALALVLLGRTDEARATLSRIASEGSSGANARSRAFARVVAHVADRRDGRTGDASDVLGSLDALRACDWNGLCRVIDMIPSTVVGPIAERAEAFA